MFLLYAINAQHDHTLRSASSGGVKFDANLDELPEIEAGLQEIESATKQGGPRSGPYWSKIRAKLLSCSSSSDVDGAIKEWSRNGWAWREEGGVCQLCGKNPIAFRFPIQNRVTGKRLVVGSECIYNYLQIPEFGTPDEIRRMLNAEINKLRKKQKGLMGEADLALHRKVLDRADMLRFRYTLLAGGASDFDWGQYGEQVLRTKHIITEINQRALILVDIQTVLSKLEVLDKLHKELAKRSKFLKTKGLIALISTVLRLHDDETKLSYLDRIQNAAGEMVQAGHPTAFVQRCWDAIKEEKQLVVERINKICDAQKERLKSYDASLDRIQPYEFLHFSLSVGMNTARKLVDNEADTAKSLVLQENFIDLITRPNNPVTSLLNISEMDPMVRFDHQMVEQARALDQLVRSMEYGVFPQVTRGIQAKYNLPGVQDKAGVKVACLRALDDGIVDFWVKEVAEDFQTALDKGNPKFIEIVEQEVDDVKALKGQALWEMLSERWGFNVQKAFKVFSRDVPFEEKFCKSLLEYWSRWPKLSPQQMAVIQRRLVDHDREVPNSMWGTLKSELVKPTTVR